jgi:hypothetical protein
VGDDWGIDDVTYNTVLDGVPVTGGPSFNISSGYQPLAPALPEPSAWALMPTGFAMIGSTARGRAKRLVRASVRL